MQDESTFAVSMLGIISDLHGSLTDEAKAALEGADRILCAGDIVSEEALWALRDAAPVTAVRGNMDSGAGVASLPKTAFVEIAGIFVYMIHDLTQLDLDPEAAGVRMVIHGHTHRASLEMRRDVLYLNPGSAAFPRGGMPPSIARVSVENGRLSPEIIPLRPVKDIRLG